MAYLRLNLTCFKSYFKRCLAVAILIAKCLNIGLETNYFSINLANFAVKNKYFVEINKYDYFEKLNSLESKKVENIFENILKNFWKCFS